MRAQASLEYLLLFAAFFAALAVILPVMSYASEQFLSASDSLLAKRISSEVSEQISLMKFLSDGSKKVFHYYPIKSIQVYSQGSNVIFSSGEKQYLVEVGSVQFIEKMDFNSKFTVILQKDKNKTSIKIAYS